MIGVHHLALVRGCIQQPELKVVERLSVRQRALRGAHARATLSWLRDELTAAAQRAQKPRIAALLRRSLPEVDAPALDEFAKVYPPDFYTEADLVGLWKEKFGKADTIVARRQRLMQRQLEALK